MPSLVYSSRYFVITDEGVFPDPHTENLTITWEGGSIPGNFQAMTVMSNGNSFTLYYKGANVDGEMLLNDSPVGFGDNYFLTNKSASEYDAGQLPASFDLINTPTCFLAGTLIATPQGEVVVESLSPGDLILAADGRALPVKWLGRQTIVTAFGPPSNDMPVLIRAGAMGEGLPHADLRVTGGHALLIDGILANAGALVNGSTITRIPRAELSERLTVYHIETDQHEIILANGVPSETFMDNVSRTRFDNFSEYAALYGEAETEMTELDLPRALSPRQLAPAIRSRLAFQAALLARDGAQAA